MARNTRPTPASPGGDQLASDAIAAANSPKVSEEAYRELHGEPGASERLEAERQRRIREKNERCLYHNYQMAPGIRPVVDACQAKARSKHSKAFEDVEVKLRQLASTYKQIADFLATVTDREASKAFKAQGPNIGAALIAGEAEKISRQDAWDKNDMLEDYSIKRRAAKQEARKIRAEAVLVAHPLVKLIEEAAREIHDEMLAKEKAEAEKFQVPFWPSAQTVAFGRMSWQPSDSAAGMVYGAAVKDIAALVGINL